MGVHVLEMLNRNRGILRGQRAEEKRVGRPLRLSRICSGREPARRQGSFLGGKGGRRAGPLVNIDGGGRGAGRRDSRERGRLVEVKGEASSNWCQKAGEKGPHLRGVAGGHANPLAGMP